MERCWLHKRATHRGVCFQDPTQGPRTLTTQRLLLWAEAFFTTVDGFRPRNPRPRTKFFPSTKYPSKRSPSLPVRAALKLISRAPDQPFSSGRLLALGVAGRYNGRMRNRQESSPMHGTTVLCVRKDGKVVLIADGQVTMGDHVMKHTARKTRRLYNDKVVAGVAGITAHSITHFEPLVGKVHEFSCQLQHTHAEF